MASADKANILIVDDQPAKLLSLKVTLSNLDVNILEADSADAALKHLLRHEVAVVLVDVCMPKMDGFELAELIRSHPRCDRTAIIFISAVHLTDADRLKGYDLGAVDYIPVPIIPEVLRAKVGVFVDLFSKTRQLEALNRELERRVAERTADVEASAARLRESDDRFQQIAHSIDEVFWLAEIVPAPRILYVSPAWERIWGRPASQVYAHPRLWTDTIHPDDRERASAALRQSIESEEASWDHERRIVRPDGQVRWIRERGRVLRAERDARVRCAGIVIDITDRKAAAIERERLLAILETTPDVVATADARGRTRYLNPAARRMLGLKAADASAEGSLLSFYDPHTAAHMRDVALPEAAKSTVWEGQTTLRTAGGAEAPVSQVVIAHRDSHGVVEAFSIVARDITEIKKAQEVLARDRETLERLVAERTEALALTSERLRLSDRMATIGTLSAGLGHDMGNLLLPVRMRLDAMERSNPPAEFLEDIAAVRQATDYLQRLSGSLRLLAMDPRSEPVETASTDLAEWWRDAEGMIRNGIPRGATLAAEVPEGLPPARIGRASLTQIVFNLVQNAGHAVRGREDGRVALIALADPESRLVRLTVADNGDGMSDEVRRRCVEPFFTTKTRELSTGMGLSLVSGIVQRAGGSIGIDSVPGAGTAIEIALPYAMAETGELIDGSFVRGVAVVRLRDPRALAHVESVLVSLRYEVRRAGAPEEADVWIADALDAESLESARLAVRTPGERRVLVLGDRPGHLNGDAGIVHIEPRLKPSALRAALREALLGAAAAAGAAHG